MQPRLTALIACLMACAGFAGLVLAALLWAGSRGVAETPHAPARLSFQIATGSTAGTFFPVGETLAGLISHPRGIGRCDAANVCGPAGLIMSARTSEGAADNLLAVDRGDVESGLTQGDVLAAALRGQDAFRRPLKHLRVIAALFLEDVHLVVAAKSNIRAVGDLRGKRVSLGSIGSGTPITARAILSAYRVPEKSIAVQHVDEFNAAALLRDGRLDAFFVVGGVPVDILNEAFAHGQARLVALDGAGRDRLLNSAPEFRSAIIPAHAYPAIAATPTVAVRAVWVTRDSVAEPLITGITRALFHAKNYAALAASHPAARDISLGNAMPDPPALLHPGAARFYSEKR